MKYHSEKAGRLEYVGGKSDWIDLRAAEDVEMKQGEFRYIDLGISVRLPVLSALCRTRAYSPGRTRSNA